jgi:nitrogen regulatory protein PII
MCEIDILITIIDRALMEAYVEISSDHGVPISLAALGHGTATDEMLDYLGLESSEKAVLFEIISYPRARAMIRDIKKKMYIDIPGNGIILTVPVRSIAGSNVLQLIAEEHEMEGGEKAMKEREYELIICITNEGHTDLVMDAARKAGAGGGTVIHAKGAVGESARKFFGVSIAEEKEMVFIVAKESQKNAIMKSIIGEAGMHTDAHALVMSLPVTSIEGLRVLEEDGE